MADPWKTNHDAGGPEVPADLAAQLGGLMSAGALIGASLACLAVVALAALGQPVVPWPMRLSGWWAGGTWPLRALAGAGILLLAATPVGMLGVLAVGLIRERRWRTLTATLGLVAVLTGGVLLALFGGA